MEASKNTKKQKKDLYELRNEWSPDKAYLIFFFFECGKCATERTFNGDEQCQFHF